jgi:hypothetical protein
MAGLLESLVESAGQAGTALDKLVGGRAVRGAMAGRPRELLSAIPFSDTLGLTDPGEATWGRDVLDAWGVTRKGQASALGDLAGFGLDVAAGPGAVAGAATLGKGAAKGLGRAAAGRLRSLDDVLSDGRIGSAVGQFLGDESGALKLGHGFDVDEMLTRAGMGRDEHLDLLHAIEGRFGGDREKAAAALLQGPRYGGGEAKLHEIAATNPKVSLRDLNLYSDPKITRFLSDELPPGSSLLGAGEEGVAFATPQGHVIRVEKRPGEPVARPDIPEMVLPFRSVVRDGRTIEHVPRVRPLDDINGATSAIERAMMFADPENPAEASALSKLMMQRMMLDRGLTDAQGRVRDSLIDRGWSDYDWHPGNIGFTPGDRLAILDPNVIGLQGYDDLSALEHELQKISPAIFGQPEATPPGGFRLSRNERPGDFLWPLLPDPESTPAFQAQVQQEASQLGVPDLIREFIETQGSRPTDELVSGAAAPEIAGISRTTGLFDRVKQGFDPDKRTGSREGFLDLVNQLDLGHNNLAGPGLLNQLQRTGLPVSWSLEQFLSGNWPKLWATLPFAALPAAMYANAENN